MKGDITTVEEIKALNHGQEGTINSQFDGGGVVVRIYEVWLLFEVPHVCGTPVFEGSFPVHRLGELLTTAMNWA